MFPHLQERIIMSDPEKTINGIVQDNVAVINAVNTDPVKNVASLHKVTVEGKIQIHFINIKHL